MNSSVKEALSKVLAEMQELNAEELRIELDKHSNGHLALSLREAQQSLELNHILNL